MRETSVIAPTAPCGRADPSAFYGDPDLPHLAAPSQASECHWHRSYHRDSSLTQAMALPSVPISEPTWLPNNIVSLDRAILGDFVLTAPGAPGGILRIMTDESTYGTSPPFPARSPCGPE